MTILAADGGLDPALFNRAGAPANARNVKNLAEDLNTVVTRVINNDIPMEHKRNHTRLKKILRGTKFGDLPSAYDPQTETIIINVPLKWKGRFRNMIRADGDKWLVRLGSSKTSDKGSFWATSPAARAAMRGDNLFEWIIRHEFGHSVDKLIQFTNRFGGNPRFGGWVRYRNNTGLLRDILIDLGVNNLKVSNALLQNDLFNKFANFLTKGGEGREWRKVDAIRKRREHVRSVLWEANDEMRRKLREAHRLIHYAIDDPWLEGNQVQHTVASGRRYLFNSYYEQWYSCLDSAFQNRISNYQFSSPSEWFAETYAAWRGFGTAFRDLLIPPQGINRNEDVVEWFDDELLETGFNQEALIGPVQNNLALGPADLPDQPDEDDLEVKVPASWHFSVSANYAIGNPFNAQAVPFPTD